MNFQLSIWCTRKCTKMENITFPTVNPVKLMCFPICKCSWMRPKRKTDKNTQCILRNISQGAQICSQMEGLSVGVSVIHDVNSKREDNGTYGATQQSVNAPVKGSEDSLVKGAAWWSTQWSQVSHFLIWQTNNKPNLKITSRLWLKHPSIKTSSWKTWMFFWNDDISPK